MQENKKKKNRAEQLCEPNTPSYSENIWASELFIHSFSLFGAQALGGCLG